MTRADIIAEMEKLQATEPRGFLHALVEDAAREAGCTVAQIRAPLINKRRLCESRNAAVMAAVEAGYSREQIARAFGKTKRSIVRAVRKERGPRYPSYPQAFPGDAKVVNAV